MKNLSDLIFTPNPLLESDQERKRLEYKPKKVRYLLMGESMPEGGNFFYFEKGDLFKFTKKAFLQNFNWPEDEFLKFFMSNGFYLDDLCQEPVNHFNYNKRKSAGEAYQESLTERIKVYDPLIVVTLLKFIEKNIERAIEESGRDIKNIMKKLNG